MANKDLFDKGDPKKQFKLEGKIATGSYGTVFKVNGRRYRTGSYEWCRR